MSDLASQYPPLSPETGDIEYIYDVASLPPTFSQELLPTHYKQGPSCHFPSGENHYNCTNQNSLSLPSDR